MPTSPHAGPSPAAGPRVSTPGRATAADPAASLADALENPRDDLDRLIGDLRLATRFGQADFDRFEERLTMILAAMRAPFRGIRPASAPPLHIQQSGGTCSAYF